MTCKNSRWKDTNQSKDWRIIIIIIIIAGYINSNWL
jgi:hypothetical protein